ncbi:NepR family anti-sigma factor [Novosphingobium sp. FKTRR1]|uniref:NepR family anti-sigma factor n=1 Tax=Novosphingobium sp. FKTRR1 TaxID=2879118 RepID=UPI001CEFDA77
MSENQSPFSRPEPSAVTPQGPRPPHWAEDIRKFYDDAAKEPVPEDFRALMEQLARQIQK